MEQTVKTSSSIPNDPANATAKSNEFTFVTLLI